MKTSSLFVGQRLFPGIFSIETDKAKTGQNFFLVNPLKIKGKIH